MPASPFQASGETSPGKNDDLPRTIAGSTPLPLGRRSFAVSGPLAPVRSASYPVPVRRLTGSFHASFSVRLTTNALRFPSVPATRFREDFHLQVIAHAGPTTTANIMLKLGAGLAPIAAVEGSTAHLKFTAYPSDPYVTLGTRFSVAVDVEPNPDIHIYAPGAEVMGYRVVSLNLRPVPHVRFEPVEFPESEIYHFEPLDERVPVYQRPFTLLQEVVVEATTEALEALSQLYALTLSGTFDFQACDDEICFEPVSLPISFTLDLRYLLDRDRQRANR